ncbi:hypothetical protein T12_5524 [Trichinella patagoniensis]|uniref:Uncharacterized protein n=1 Tax=Trichinella patagoniensis TaxID=990121 RepID=A0A0V0Z123_9BILA|nr:hypothetical protein T12_5524 [Trichinella patagoniensis]
MLNPLMDCWGGAHPTLEKHVSKNSVHDGIICRVSFVEFVKQITDLSRARYSVHFDTKLSSIIFFWVLKSLISYS